MTRGRRAGVLVGLLLASVVAGLAVGAAAGASQTPTADNESAAVANTTIVHDGDRVTLTAAANERIRGETDLPAGTSLTLQVQSTNATSPFLATGEATVADNGTFAGTVDLSNVQANASAEVIVRNESTRFARANATVVGCVENCSDPGQWPEFTEGIFLKQPGEAAEIRIDVPEEADGPVNLTIGDEDVDFLVETTVDDANDDGRIALVLNASSAGNGSPDEYLSAREDGIVAAEQRSDVVDGPLDAGHYDLELGPADAPYDVATLAITRSERDAGDEGHGDAGDETDDASGIDVETTGEVTFLTAGDVMEIGSAEGQPVRAETELEPGTTVSLRFSSTDASNPFLFTPEATVTEYGTINATVDMSQVEPGSPFELVARHDGEAVGATAGRVVDCDGDCPRVASGSAGAADRSDAANGSDQNESNVVEVDDDGSLPVAGLAAIGIGGVLSIVGLVRFTGLLQR